MTSRRKFPGVDVLSVKYPSRGAHVIYVRTGPMRTDSITAFGNWVCDQLDGYIGKFEEAKAQPSGVVRFTFYRQKDGEIIAPSLSRVDRETIAETLGARYTRELVANTAFIHRDEDGYHDGTVIKLYHEDGELFDTTHAEAIRALDVVQDVTLDEKSCLFTMAAPARNDDDGAITAGSVIVR